MPHTVYFIRHGQTEWNVAGRLQGQTDIPINETGQGQALRNGATLAGLLSSPQDFDFVCSPLSRTRETMEIIRRKLGLEPTGARTDDRLKEIRFGKFEGKTYAEAAADMPEEARLREENKWLNAPPGGESYADLTLRVGDWFSSITCDTVCVSHGGVSRALRGYVLDIPKLELVELDIPQDKVLKIVAGQIEWL